MALALITNSLRPPGDRLMWGPCAKTVWVSISITRYGLVRQRSPRIPRLRHIQLQYGLTYLSMSRLPQAGHLIFIILPHYCCAAPQPLVPQAAFLLPTGLPRSPSVDRIGRSPG